MLPLVLQEIQEEVISCEQCSRLVHFRQTVPPKPIHEKEIYWRRPTPGFGDPDAWLLLVGPAPAAHGGNRTGRMFTGDSTSDFLMKALYEKGWANQPTSTSRDDGLQLTGCFLTDVVKCSPPQHKPLKSELKTCSGYFQRELQALKHLSHVLLMGKIAFDQFFRLYADKLPAFHHGARYAFPGLPIVYASYHPSPRNTQTGRLTYTMFSALLNEILLDFERVSSEKIQRKGAKAQRK